MSRVANAAAVSIQCWTRIIKAKKEHQVLREADAQRKAAAAMTIGSRLRTILAKKELQKHLASKSVSQTPAIHDFGIWLKRLFIAAALIALARTASRKPITREVAPSAEQLVPQMAPLMAPQMVPQMIPKALDESSEDSDNMTATTLFAIFSDQFRLEHTKFAMESM
jgi:hypothetical protein